MGNCNYISMHYDRIQTFYFNFVLNLYLCPIAKFAKDCVDFFLHS